MPFYALSQLLLCALIIARPNTPDPRFQWIAAIEAGPQDQTYQLKAQTYYVDRQYLLPNGTQLIGASGGATKVLAVATTSVQQRGVFHGCGANHKNRIGFVLSSRCRIAELHYTGIERARYPDSHPLCGGAPFQTPGCATAYCEYSQNSSWLTFGGAPVHDVVIENITIAGGTVQNAVWMPENPAGYCTNITIRNIEVAGSCAEPGPCAPSTAGEGGGTWADGINIHGAHRDVLVERNRIPHTGDDSFAIWSKGTAETNVIFSGNYAASPRYPRTWLASCFAMYGGNQSVFANNTCIQSGVRGAIYLVQSFHGGFIPNVSFADISGNNFTNCCPISPGHSICGVNGPIHAPGCSKQ